MSSPQTVVTQGPFDIFLLGPGFYGVDYYGIDANICSHESTIKKIDDDGRQVAHWDQTVWRPEREAVT